MKNIKICLMTLVMIAAGFFGIVFFFGESEDYVKLLLSKPVGILLIILSYKLQLMIYKQSIFNNH